MGKWPKLLNVILLSFFARHPEFEHNPASTRKPKPLVHSGRSSLQDCQSLAGSCRHMAPWQYTIGQNLRRRAHFHWTVIFRNVFFWEQPILDRVPNCLTLTWAALSAVPQGISWFYSGRLGLQAISGHSFPCLLPPGRVCCNILGFLMWLFQVPSEFWERRNNFSWLALIFSFLESLGSPGLQ